MSCAAIPNFEAARFWTGSAFAAAGGAAVAMLRFFVDSLLPLLAGGTVLIFAACLAAMGIKRFYDQPVSWRATALISRGLSFAGLAFFIVGYDSMPMRILIYSLGPVGAAGADAEAVVVHGTFFASQTRALPSKDAVCPLPILPPKLGGCNLVRDSRQFPLATGPFSHPTIVPSCPQTPSPPVVHLD